MTTLKAFVRRGQPMPREYHKWFSPNLQSNMELLVFGYGGQPMLFFPTRMARFYDYENWGVINSLEEKILGGKIQIFCLDSVDKDSFYNKNISPAERIQRHSFFENYVLFEVMPFIRNKNPNHDFISVGCSLGAYHAVNIAFRFPQLFKKVVALSGRYDLTIHLQYFDDLFDGFWNHNIYYNMPGQFIKNLKDGSIIHLLQKLEIVLAVGEMDVFLKSNIELSGHLKDRNIHHAFYVWNGEAHKAKYWSQMLPMYL